MVGLFHSGLDAGYGGADPNAPFNENASMLVADQVPGFDIVFSGHDHQKKVLVIQNVDSKQVLVLNAGAHAKYVARADINMHWDTGKKSWHKKLSGSLVRMKNIQPDSVFLKKFDYWFKETKDYVSEEITVLDSDIKAEDALYGPSAFVDMIHKAQLQISGADISFAAPFSISAVLKKGTFTRADLFNLYRYENFLCTIKLKGYEIKKYLEYSTDLWFDTCVNTRGTRLLLSDKDNKEDSYIKLKNAYYNFDSGAGIRYVITPDAERGSRVKIISMADGSPFDMNKTYTVALNSYRANGGGGHLTDGVGLSKEELKSRLINCTKDDFRDLLGKWLASQERPFKARALGLWSAKG
jgi:2',3'-cyclic-nucleotide 2'-phosphodiesterase/3'-nucleotidase